MNLSQADSAKQLLDVIPRTMRVLRAEFAAMARDEMGERELSVSQFRTLLHVSRGAVNNSKLAELMGLSVAATSRMVDSVVRGGLLRRRTSKSDRRQVTLSLTQDGRETVDRAQVLMRERLALRLSALEPAKRARLDKALAALSLLDEVFQ